MDKLDRHILLIAQTPSIGQHLCQALSTDYVVTIEKRLSRAMVITASLDNPPHLILLEMAEPFDEMLRFAETLKLDPTFRSLPLIAIIDRYEESIIADVIGHGFDDLIFTPFIMAHVKKQIENQLYISSLEKRLVEKKLRDPVTGMYTRGRFDEVIDQEWRRCLRNQKPISLILIAIEFSKQSSHHHLLAINTALRQAADCLQDVSRRAADFVARYNFETFAILLPETDASGTVFVAQRALKSISQLNPSPPDASIAAHPTISLGCATITPERDITPVTLIEAASRMVFLAKKDPHHRIKYLNLDD